MGKQVKTILKNIAQLRRQFPYSQEEVAQRIGMSQVNYGRLERGHHKMTIETLFKIADVLETTVFRLMMGTHEGANYDGMFNSMHQELAHVIKKYEEMSTKMNFLNQL